MALAHPIRPDSAFARELREERQKGIDQGMEQGLELEKLEVIQGMLAKGFDWQTIQDITHLDQAGYETLQAKHPR